MPIRTLQFAPRVSEASLGRVPQANSLRIELLTDQGPNWTSWYLELHPSKGAFSSALTLATSIGEAAADKVTFDLTAEQMHQPLEGQPARRLWVSVYALRTADSAVRTFLTGYLTLDADAAALTTGPPPEPFLPFATRGEVQAAIANLSAKADKSIVISAGAGLEGGGTLAASRTLSLAPATVQSLARADSAVQPEDLGTAATRNIGVSAGSVPPAEATVRTDASNLQSEVIRIAHLAQEVRDQFAGGVTFPLSNFLGTIASTSFDFPAAASNSGKWYLSNVDGTPSGTNAPATDLIAGGRVHSNGSAWIVTPPPPTNLPDGIVTRFQTSADLRLIFQFVEETLQEFWAKLTEANTLWLDGSSDEWATLATAKSTRLAAFSKIDGTFAAYFRDSDPELYRVIGHNLDQRNLARYIGANGRLPFFLGGNNVPMLEWDLGISAWRGKFVNLFAHQPTPTEGEPGGPLAPEHQIVPADWNISLVYGDSMSVGAQGLPVISGPSIFGHKTFSGGPKASGSGLTSSKTLEEDSNAGDGGSNRGETPCSGLANGVSLRLMREAQIMPAQHMMHVSAPGHGGYQMHQIAPDAPWFNLVREHIEAAANHAAAASATSALHAFLFFHGPNDSAAGTISRSAYAAGMEAIRAAVEAEAHDHCGQTHPVRMLAVQSSYGARTYPAVTLAQWDASRANPLIDIIAVTHHLPHHSDNTHLTALGYLTIGHYAAMAYADMVMGRRPRQIVPLKGVVVGNQAELYFATPAPLALDYETLAICEDGGFVFEDDGGPLTISSLITIAPHIVQVTFTTEPIGTVVCRYGQDFTPEGNTVIGVAGGNLRAANEDYFTHEGERIPLPILCPAFDLTLHNLNS